MKTYRRLQSTIEQSSTTDRTVTAVLSDERVALDNHVIKTDGIDFSEYNRSVLFAHDQKSPPVGKMVSLWKRGTQLLGKMQFAEAETYPFADVIYRLIRGKYLNSMSVSWFPIAYEYARDRDRPDGINFIKCKLLEASVVPVPANAGAIIEARSAGIDMSPLNTWARAASRSQSEVTRHGAETLIRALSRRAARAPSSPMYFEEMRLEAKKRAAKISAQVLIYEWPRREIEGAVSASRSEFIERAFAGGLSTNEVRQLEAIFDANLIPRAKACS